VYFLGSLQLASCIAPPPQGQRTSHEQPEGVWPHIRAALAAEKIAERRSRAANPSVYMDGYVPGGGFESITLPSQG
jgi:hypothetical protein